MKGNTRHWFVILLGIIIAIADLYWLSDSYSIPHWLYAGIIIFVADVLWLYLDWH